MHNSSSDLHVAHWSCNDPERISSQPWLKPALRKSLSSRLWKQGSGLHG
jgi:hypothetical protein